MANLNNSVLSLVDSRKTNFQQLWIAGCSYAHGIGLDPQNNRYGQLVSNYFEIPVSFLSQGGTSIEWAADQIIRSDITPGDILIWGITGVNRFVHWQEDGNMISVTPTLFNTDNPNYNSCPDHVKNQKEIWLELMHDKSRLYHAIRQISQVISFCKKIKCNLILACHPELSIKNQSDILLEFLQGTGLYVDLPHRSESWTFTWPADYRRYLDKGTDNRHPGPLTHKLWSEIFIEEIENKGYINEE